MVSGYDKRPPSGRPDGRGYPRGVRWAFVAGLAVAAVAILLLLTLTQEVPAQECHPSYDPCLPIVSDVDCAGGGGDGPVYVTGPVRVIGPDTYRLDRDGDGVACAPN